MCGPLALALPPSGTGAVSYATGRLAYNFGRIITYTVLGLFFGLVGRSLVLAGVQRWTSIALGIFLMAGLLASRKISLGGPLYAVVGSLRSHMGRLLRQRTIASLGVLGLLNGLLPCGLVYVACAGATVTGSAASGAAYMVVFGLGTLPMMLAISLSGKLVPPGWRLRLTKAIPVTVFLLASVLILRGMSLGIPYLSPDLSPNSPQPACCHP
jgi:sulfite exporter TauE/SafE